METRAAVSLYLALLRCARSGSATIGEAVIGTISEKKKRNKKTNHKPLFREFEARDCAGREATGCVEGPRRIKRDGRCARFTSSSAVLPLTHFHLSLSLSLSLCPPPSFLSFFSGVPPTPSLNLPLYLSLSLSLPLAPPSPPRSACHPVPLTLARSRSLLSLSHLPFSLPLTVAVSLAPAIHVPPPSYPPSGGLDSVEKKRRFGG